MELTDKEVIFSEDEKKIALQNAITLLCDSENFNQYRFYGHLLQSLNINYSKIVPTAGVLFNSKQKEFQLYLNPNFFCSLPIKEQVAVLLHEIFHITFKHVYFNTIGFDKRLLNVSMDMVINQLIKDLPKCAIFVESFKTKDGKDFPLNQTVEVYYDLIQDGAEFKLSQPGGDKSDNKQEGQSESEGQEGNGEGTPGDKQGKGSGQYKQISARQDEQGNTWVNAKEYFEENNGFDEHGWQDGDDGDVKDKLESLRDLFKRTIQKSSFSYSNVPQSVQDLLQSIETQINELDCKAILLSTLKKSMPSRDTRKTWTRPSRRYQELAPGTTIGLMPKVDFYADSSGSISVTEMNEILKVVNNFMTVGVEKAEFHLFHTQVYHNERIKRGFQIAEDKFQSGGTDLTECFTRALKRKPELMVILTDGYYGRPEINYKKLAGVTNVVFIITKGGNKDHPLKDIGKTVHYNA